jgi:hypothetical protein
MNGLDGIATGDKLSFQHTKAFSKMFARSAADVIPRTRKAFGANKTMSTVYFTTKKFIVLDALPRGSTSNQLYFINDICPDLQTANLSVRHQMSFRGRDSQLARTKP